MNTIQNLFQQAQLAEATYANLTGMTTSTSPDALALALRAGDGKFSAAQASDFITHWRVVNQYTAPSGLFGFQPKGSASNIFLRKSHATPPTH